MSPIPVTITCHCRTSTHFSHLPPNITLPFGIDACHCLACREATGVEFNTYIPLQPSSAPFSLTSLPNGIGSYKTGPRSTRFFCRVCGAHLAIEFDNGAQWYAASGVVESAAVGEQQLTRVTWHQWLVDTVDGGVLRSMRTDRRQMELPVYITLPDSGAFEFPSTVSTAARKHHKLDFGCRCGKNKITLARPDGNGRFPAYHCVCTACRLTSGFPYVSWAGVPRSVIDDDETKRIEKETIVYEDKKGATRYSCKGCGACVMVKGHVDDEVLIATGLVQMKDGEGIAGLQEEWFDWKVEVMGEDEVRKEDREIMEALRL